MSDATSHNPYSTPATPLDRGSEAKTQLASLGQRLGGRIVDSVILELLVIPLLFVMGFREFVEKALRDPLSIYTESLAGALTGAASLGISILNWYLIVKRGQTLGKMVAGTRIVGIDGSPVSFVQGVVLRSWVLALPAYTMLAAGAMGMPTEVVIRGSQLASWGVLLTYLPIFGRQRRCLHDYIAGTRVVRH